MSRLLRGLPKHLLGTTQTTRATRATRGTRTSFTTIQRPYSSSSPSSFDPGPSPPRLPPDEQAEFERLQRKAAISSAFHPDDAQLVSSSSSSSSSSSPSSPAAPSSTPRHTTSATSQTQPQSQPQQQQTQEAEDSDPNPGGVFRGAPPEFEGDVNPRTGEVGGPKNEPLRWGDKSDWSYNGRVTDF
ncbi:DUF1674-domain-containing protein [Sodiomyces alkalinus F11]|uniref:Succinate dehydrogenase assembly factor 4, mitochondrial n=1 Tax=Sodiomyces alkalinus (strain CBS 110278 / VKM F-3762 / F11) TaxID=1314773 RepID=A0A3N2Q136_SODAK|nr:DUF1674-domain-containing protein [Sodiomyces alkalinus F11]ROT40426.1 DUF1674-domain-containing protein [Sodiomyces alkalinus F11]